MPQEKKGKGGGGEGERGGGEKKKKKKKKRKKHPYLAYSPLSPFPISSFSCTFTRGYVPKMGKNSQCRAGLGASSVQWHTSNDVEIIPSHVLSLALRSVFPFFLFPFLFFFAPLFT